MSADDEIRALAERAAATKGAIGVIARSADVAPEALAILDEFARLEFPGTAEISKSSPGESAVVTRKLIAGGHVIGLAVWIEG